MVTLTRKYKKTHQMLQFPTHLRIFYYAFAHIMKKFISQWNTFLCMAMLFNGDLHCCLSQSLFTALGEELQLFWQIWYQLQLQYIKKMKDNLMSEKVGLRKTTCTSPLLHWLNSFFYSLLKDCGLKSVAFSYKFNMSHFPSRALFI